MYTGKGISNWDAYYNIRDQLVCGTFKRLRIGVMPIGVDRIKRI